ncbi:S-adenosylmethionine:tRNA ribosyltransferase-isomerase [hydrothermal vent metagenome]|uniref:S-adenosylmethionine:tRNA ribosyltransferase-isomerase n=1 Tax=hydrothermal vent metagenome TaxID=652676 RepID=A0A3B0TJ39_9ZZZZ
MLVSEFDFDLPEDLIALHPVSPRDSARLLHVNKDGQLSERHVSDLIDLLVAGDVLVINETRVLPAALAGTRVRGQNRAAISFNLHKRINSETWAAFARPAKRLKAGDRLIFGQSEDRACALEKLQAIVERMDEGGQAILRFDLSGPYLDEAIKSHGAMPLPPYIGSKRAVEPRDKKDYQTIYARNDGAVAAPTAGLHFTDQLLEKLDKKGVIVERVTLHVGAGTFLPVKVDQISEHKMHAEWGEISAETVENINRAKSSGGRIVAVGTTSLRLLEAAARPSGKLAAFCADTDIFITPGFDFNVVDLLMTNFHLPRSTLFMLVCAFSGFAEMKAAYACAIKNSYRFYSYGDASLLVRKENRTESINK